MDVTKRGKLLLLVLPVLFLSFRATSREKKQCPKLSSIPKRVVLIELFNHPLGAERQAENRSIIRKDIWRLMFCTISEHSLFFCGFYSRAFIILFSQAFRLAVLTLALEVDIKLQRQKNWRIEDLKSRKIINLIKSNYI